jgi:hypothetical protein
VSTISEEMLRGLPLEELRQLQSHAERVLFDRRCHASLLNFGPCMAEPPHADGWHETTQVYPTTATPAYSGMPQPAVIRWRFDDEVVVREHEHEAQRRPGAN